MSDASSLVRLRRFAGLDGTSYVNASSVPPSLFPQWPLCWGYIAAQAPLASYAADFWHLLWEQRVLLLVMLTRLKERWKDDVLVRKADRYWPEEDEGEVAIGQLRVQCTHTQRHTDAVIVRRFRVRLAERGRRSGDGDGGGEEAVEEEEEEEEQREVVHVQYVGWPDHGVPPDPASFAAFFSVYRSLRACTQRALHPLLVHCSAGIGRTGTFLAIDVLLDAVSDGAPAVSVLNTVRVLRSSRPGMVQTKAQYAFVFRFVDFALQRRMFGLGSSGSSSSSNSSQQGQQSAPVDPG